MDAQTLLDSEMGQLLGTTQEISVIAPRVALALRPGIGEWRCALLHIDFSPKMRCSLMTTGACSRCKLLILATYVKPSGWRKHA